MMTVSEKKKVAVNAYRPAQSVCPICKKRIVARLVKRNSSWYMEKICDEHGSFSTVIWRGKTIALSGWGSYSPPKNDKIPDNCPEDCGLCEGHLQDTCCVLVEITKRCNLNCAYCFANSGESALHNKEKTPQELFSVFSELVSAGRSFVQLSGGEPTVRDDLPEIVAAAKSAGCDSIQLNSNGLRLGSDIEYTKKLVQSGLSFVFMQFDGLSDEVYTKLRGRPLLQEKLNAINVCGELGLGVTLVPTIVPSVNDGEIGEIIKFAVRNSPVVRGVHFQPVSYFGRVPRTPRNKERITLPEIVEAIAAQTNGLVKLDNLKPSLCDHPRCGFHGDFVVLPGSEAAPDGELMPLSSQQSGSSCCGKKTEENQALKNRNFVARRWKRSSAKAEAVQDISEMDGFLSRVKSHGFTITGMAFQDAFNLDIERLRRCSLHVYDEGRIVPFCAYYL